MKRLEERIMDFWCNLMHTDVMWPSHGHYECLTCGRRYPVCWESAPVGLPAHASTGRLAVIRTGRWVGQN